MASLEVLAGNVDLVDLLAAMFPLPGEFKVDQGSEGELAWMRGVVEQGEQEGLDKHAGKAVKLNIVVWEEGASDCAIELEISLSPERRRPDIAVRRAESFTRQEVQALASKIIAQDAQDSEEASGLVLAAVDRVREYLAQRRELVDAAQDTALIADGPAQAEERIWFWFPSLSTRAKRQDLVDYAGRRGLTGFVLAGKPGLLCVEGQPKLVNEYMSAIKSESWSDIPSYQKKVTERHRERITSRAFPDMQEITDRITQYGRFGNRGEMGEVRAFLDGYGVGEALGVVLGTGGGAG